jgi:exodeoxyribonuclease V alpha subunit
VSDQQLLDAVAFAEGLSASDRVLANAFVRLSGSTGDAAAAVALATACLSHVRDQGHSALSLEDLAEDVTELIAANDHGQWPKLAYADPHWWEKQLSGSLAVVSDGLRPAPIALHSSLLQFRRYLDAERRIAKRIGAWLDAGGEGFRIITGGPGTGKTTHVARTLVETVERDPSLRIALAAPTGKAAARVSESIRLRLDDLKAPEVVRARVPQDAQTLHRLLRYQPWNDHFAAREGAPLGADLVIVDEASMVDVLMMDSLIAALSSRTRLVLVGDHNQLASVDAGDVLGALCRAAQQRGAGSPLHRSVTWLTHSYRFAAHPGIGALAEAILAADGERAMALLRDGRQPDVAWMAPPESTDALLAPLVPHLERCLEANSPREMLSALDAFRVLCPEREGVLGVGGINRAVERWLQRRGADVRERWYHRRPVLVTANDYGTQVFNGDLGVAWASQGEVLVHFPAAMNNTRAIAPARLPETETAWAMTVHKSQGSEFDEVLVVLPAKGSRVLGRELLYTAVTRARHRVTVVGADSVMAAAIARTSRRQSGLERLLETT